jgi:hypothetical protein
LAIGAVGDKTGGGGGAKYRWNTVLFLIAIISGYHSFICILLFNSQAKLSHKTLLQNLFAFTNKKYLRQSTKLNHQAPQQELFWFDQWIAIRT